MCAYKVSYKLCTSSLLYRLLTTYILLPPSTGIDFLESDELPGAVKKGIIMTNAKGQFSSSLAEYVMMACSYFAKDIPRLLQQKGAKVWNDFDIEELRGKTMGMEILDVLLQN